MLAAPRRNLPHHPLHHRMMPGKGSKGKIDPSRRGAAAGDDTDIPVADRDDRVGPRGSVGSAGWHCAAAGGGLVGGIRRHSNGDPDRSARTGRTPLGTFDKSAVVELLRRDPPPCVIAGGDWTTAVLSWQGVNSSALFCSANCFAH